MESLAFACPHCNGPFRVKQPLEAAAVACPHCGQAVALSAAAAASDGGSTAGIVERAAEPPQIFVSDANDPAPSGIAAPPAAVTIATGEDSRQRSEQRRLLRNAVLMVFGVAVLVVAVLYLVRLQP